MNAYSGALPPVYDALMQGADYPGKADYLTSFLKSHGVADGAIVLELGCGTGAMTVEMARRGWDMIALDNSYDMLEEARARMQREGLTDRVLLLAQDMTAFELYGSVAAVICPLDGVNYLTDLRALRACFRCVHNYLDDDGFFCFDVNTPHKLKDVCGRHDFILTSDGVYCGWQNRYDEEQRLCAFDLSVFTDNGDGTWSRRNETHYEKSWGVRSLTQNLVRCGFEDVAFHSGYADAEALADDERWLITARRPARQSAR